MLSLPKTLHFGRRRPKLIRQTESRDCAAAALATLCSYFGHPPKLGDLKRIASIDREGTSMAEIADASEQLGLTCEARDIAGPALDQLEGPAIVALGYHFVVVDKVRRKSVRIGDPSSGWRELPRAEFDRLSRGVALVLRPGAAYIGSAARLQPARTAPGFWQLLAGTRSMLTTAVLLSLIGNFVGLALPVLTQLIVDRTGAAHSLGNYRIFWLVGSALVLGGLIEFIRQMTINRIAARLYVGVGATFLRHLMSLPWAYFLNRPAGDCVNRMEEVQRLANFAGSRGAQISVDVVLIVLSTAIVFFYQARVGFFLLGSAVLLLLSGLILGGLLISRLLKAIQIQVQALSTFLESVRKIAVLKSYGAEHVWAKRWENKATEAAQLLVRGRDTGNLFGAVIQMILRVTPFAIVVLGLSGSHPLSMGSLISITAIATVALSSILNLSSALVEAQQVRLGLRRLNEVFEEDPEPAAHGAAPHLPGAPVMAVDNLSFRYTGQNARPALDGISFTIERGSMVAIVGPSGSGKTTLAHVLTGLLVPSTGRYLFDGHSTDEISPADLRTRAALVHQDCPLVEGTILDNIALGDPHPDFGRAYEAADLAQALGFILEHPLKFERRLSEDGIGLSAGQRQRIAIARALYRNPEVIVLDEPTSALDSESEAGLVRSFHSLKSHKTVIIIAHRLRTIAGVDQIMVLRQGRLIEAGTAPELLRRGGHFAALVEASESDPAGAILQRSAVL